MPAWRALDPDEREAAFERIHDLRLIEASNDEGLVDRLIRSLRRIAEHVGSVPAPDEYRQAHRELKAAGEDIASITEQINYWGTWRAAKEALTLSDTTTARRIDARFRYRKLGKVWRYTDEVLAATLARAAEHYGHPPTVAEFDWWRESELEKARVAGDTDLHLPSASPYRKRWKTWERALLAHGFTAEQTTQRFQQG